MLVYLLFSVLLKYFSLIRRRHHCRWTAAKFRPVLCAMEVHVKLTAYQEVHVQGHDFAPCNRAVTCKQLRVEQKLGGTVWALVNNVTTSSAKFPWTPVLQMQNGRVKCYTCASVRECTQNWEWTVIYWISWFRNKLIWFLIEVDILIFDLDLRIMSR
jgi:hypothetical protein